MSATATVCSIQVGLPRVCGREGADDPHDRAWTTGFYKAAVVGPVWLSRTNFVGDGQADLVHHGGPDKAVCAYSADHYDYWRGVLGQPEMAFGAFGENLTITGLREGDVCVGDVWRVGDAELEVSQPRQPCWKLARRWRRTSLVAEVVQSGRTGWYFRVRREGAVAAGQTLRLLARANADWSVARANHLMHHDKGDLAAAAELAGLATLSASWRETLSRRGGP